MYNESTTIVDVVTLGEDSYELSMKAEDLWVAFEVVRRHIDTNGARHYSQMVEAKITADGYSFKFDTGDVYTCASHEEYPASETMSDESGGGSGGGVQLPVEIVTYTRNTNGTFECDHTYEALVEAYQSGVPCVAVLKNMSGSQGSAAVANSVAPITTDYAGTIVFVTLFERIVAGGLESATTASIWLDRIEHKSDGSVTKRWSKKRTITFDA